MIHPEAARLGATLRSVRGSKTLREAAKETGYDFTWLSKVENGRELPSWDALKTLVECYGDCDLRPWAYHLLTVTKPEQFKLALRHARSRWKLKQDT